MMKQGMTMISLVLYVILFFAFTVLAISISSNLNYRLLSEKGLTITNEDYLKLYTNLFNSSKNSESLDIIDSRTFSFSNGDNYQFDSSKNIITKNGGVLIKNVSNFEQKTINDAIIDVNVKSNIDSSKCFVFKINLKKYNYELNKNIVITLGDDISEQ